MKTIRNKLLVALLSVTILPTLLIGGYSLFSTTNTLRDTSISAQEGHVSLLSERVESFLDGISSDLFYLRDSGSMNLYLSALQSNSKESGRLLLANLKFNFKAFSEKKEIYHQIRFIDTSGMEVARVNNTGNSIVIVGDNALQNKKGRYYFDDAINLPAGELMISPLDLNHEKGKVEQPLRPTIRFATPVFDNTNTLRGIIIVNVLAQYMLDLISAQGDEQGDLIFADTEGYYFVHPDKDRVWGSDKNLGTGYNLKVDIPEMERVLSNNNKLSTLETDDAFVSYSPVYVDSKKSRPLGIIINYVPKSVSYALVKDFTKVFALIALVALLITVFISILLSRSISQPVITLASEVRRLSKGELDAPIDVETSDEIGELSHAIERLRKSMRILMKRME